MISNMIENIYLFVYIHSALKCRAAHGQILCKITKFYAVISL